MKAIVRSLVRWSWLLILCLLLGWFGGKLLTAVLPPTYQATAIVQLNAQTNTSQIVQSVEVYAALVPSDSVLGQVLKKYPQIDRQALVSKQLTMTSDDPSQTISIQVTLSDPKLTADMANELAQLLVDQQNAYIKSQYTKEIQIVGDRIAAEQTAIDHLNRQIAQTPSSNATALQQLSSQVSQQQDLQSQHRSTQQSLQTEQALDSAPLSIVQSATVASKTSSLINLIPLAPLMAVIALILALVAIGFLEQSTGRINEAFTLQQKTTLPVLGSLRWTSPAPQSVPIQVLCESNTPYTEDCRMMMADILFHAEEAEARVLAITGLKLHSGMSTVAAQLAALLAQSKRRVLLIDANLYEPSLHERMEIPNEAGLARILEEARRVTIGANGRSGRTSLAIEERVPLQNYIIPTRVQDLFLVPAGRPTLNPNSLLSMPEMEQFLQWASRSVDFIVIDCPALIRAEAYVLGSLADQTFLLVDATRDRQKQVVNTKEELLNTGVKLSGLIVNKLGRWI